MKLFLESSQFSDTHDSERYCEEEWLLDEEPVEEGAVQLKHDASYSSEQTLNANIHEKDQDDQEVLALSQSVVSVQLSPTHHPLQYDQDMFTLDQSVISVQPSPTHQPLQSEPRLRFLIEPSTYINLASLFESVFQPALVRDQIALSHPSLRPIQSSPMSVLPVLDQAYGNTTQTVLQRTTVMSKTGGAGNSTFIQNVVIQNVNMQPEIQRVAPVAQQETFSMSFIAQRHFGFTKKASLQNNVLTVIIN